MVVQLPESVTLDALTSAEAREIRAVWPWIASELLPGERRLQLEVRSSGLLLHSLAQPHQPHHRISAKSMRQLGALAASALCAMVHSVS